MPGSFPAQQGAHEASHGPRNIAGQMGSIACQPDGTFVVGVQEGAREQEGSVDHLGDLLGNTLGEGTHPTIRTLVRKTGDRRSGY
jgi:hypothetical protein